MCSVISPLLLPFFKFGRHMQTGAQIAAAVGAPAIVTTHGSSQFESTLFLCLTHLLGRLVQQSITLLPFAWLNECTGI